MDSLWNDEEASGFVARYGQEWGEDLALRCYTSRLIGRDPSLVLHGGGNTSVKTVLRDVLGEPVEALCVKGSGWDLAGIEPPGLPALDLARLRRLRRLERLSDEAMVDLLRTCLLKASSPSPSVETLLHAFLPHKFVDHTHADAVLALTNQPEGERVAREALGEEVVVLPWIFPGFPLAGAVAEAFEAQPDCLGVVLVRHGLFTFGEDARSSYERTIALVDRAERFLASRVQGRPAWLGAAPAPAQARAAAAAVAPLVRGAVAVPTGDPHRPWRPLVAAVRTDPEVLPLAGSARGRELATAGPLTPDHALRTRPWYLVLAPAPSSVEEARRAVAAWSARYRGYVEEGCRAQGREVAAADFHPRVVLVEGAGLFAFGATARQARAAADIAAHNLRARIQAAALGRYEPLDGPELFAVEYWSLEQAKLGRRTPPVLEGRAALVTGGAGAIGTGIARSLLEAGCNVVLADVDGPRLEKALARLADAGPGEAAVVEMDVTDEASVRAGFAQACLLFAGLDLVVPNAGVAEVADLDAMDAAAFRRVVEVNLTGVWLVVREAAALFKAQGTGGHVVISASKNVFDPGAGLAAYSASKAGAHQLGKVAALELAESGIRVNLVNADAVFGDEEIPSGLWQKVGAERMRRRGLDPEELREHYRQRSLLNLDVRPEHVGNAVVFFASSATPTTGATLPVDAGIPGAFPR